LNDYWKLCRRKRTKQPEKHQLKGRFETQSCAAAPSARALATTSLIASNTLMASMKGGSPMAIRPNWLLH
jgi:hypothetical protein